MPRTYVFPNYDPNVIRREPQNIGNARAQSTGGRPFQGAVLDRPGYQGLLDGSSIDRAPGNTNDTLITRVREYVWRRAYSLPVATASANISWIDSGPTRDMPTTRFNRNIRPIVGGSNQVYEGMHTYLPTGQKGDSQLAGKKRMTPGRQNRLTVQRYRGQSYSSTTQVIR